MIRHATESDLAALGYMAWALDQDHQARGEPSVADALAIGIDHAWETKQPIVVAEEDGRLVGFCLWIGLPANKAHEATCFGTYVDPAYRGRGLSAALRDGATTACRERGIHTFHGSVVVGNQAGLESAVKDGFRMVGYLVRKEINNGQGNKEGR